MAGSRGKPAKTLFQCVECGWTSRKWVGRCGQCQAWGTVEETSAEPAGRTAATAPAAQARPITAVDAHATARETSGIGELDRVLGGGMVPGGVLLLAGEPGVGKSTLLLEAAAQWARAGRRTLYASAEESASQVRLRAQRMDAAHDELYLANETDLSAVLGHIDQVQPSLLIIDSVQTVAANDIDGVPGGVTQLREVARSLINTAKRRNIPTILVGHVTKDGSVAGPRVLEHLVDVVLQFEGDRQSRLRLLRAVKNRFGPVDEIGCFDLTGEGIIEVTDPTGLFISRHETPVPGTSITVTMEGRRPLLAELQALTVDSTTAAPRRTTSGLDSARIAMIIAVLTKHAGLPLHNLDVYASTVGGVRLSDPGTDLAFALALGSAVRETPVPGGLVAFGEVGLAGEVRKVPHLAGRLREAARIGFTDALVPAGVDENLPDGIRVRYVSNIAQALNALSPPE